MVPRVLKSIFGRKKKISYFRPKIDPGSQKSIFEQKIENSIFRSKFGQKMVPRGLKSILIEK